MNRKRIKEVRFVLGKEHFVLKCQNISFCGLYINALKAYPLVLRVNVNCSITSSYEFLHLDFSHSRQALLKRFFKGLYQCKAYLSPSYFCLSPNKRRSFVCKGTKNNYLCNYFNNFIRLFHRKRLFADFFFTNKMFESP